MKPDILHKLLSYLLRNILDVATVLVAMFVVIKHWIHPPQNLNDGLDLLNWIVALLGLIAISSLWDRNRSLRRIEALLDGMQETVKQKFSGKALARDFFSHEHKLPPGRIVLATHICLTGISLTRAVREYAHSLTQRLAAGAHVRIIIVEPSEEVLPQLAYRSTGPATVEYWRHRLQASDALIKALADYEEVKGKLELGYLPYVPSFGLAMLNPNDQDGLCSVEIYQHQSTEASPGFTLQAEIDQPWYQFFCHQFDIMWKSCRVIEVTDPEQRRKLLAGVSPQMENSEKQAPASPSLNRTDTALSRGPAG